jgi:peptidoglycan/LPS O-acetylase OafA/YrhL
MAILMVVVAHSFCLLQRMTGVRYLGKAITLIDRYIINLGPIGVELFFVLSGFLIGGILVKLFDRGDFSFATVRQFWIRRWFRTLPAYWLILTVNILIYVFVKGNSLPTDKLLGYVFLQNLWYPDLLNIFPEGWSLAVEEWFYLTLPVVMLAAATLAKPARKEVFLLRVFAGYLIVFTVLRIVNALHPINGIDPDEGIRKVVIFRLDAVMYGVIFACLNYYKPRMLDRVRKPLFRLSIICAAVLYFFVVRYELAYRAQVNETFRFCSNAFLYTLIPLIFSLSLPYASVVTQLGSRLLSRVVGHISKISYSMYLVHFSLFVPALYAIRISSAAVGILWYLAYWLLVVVLSSLLYRFFEAPVMQLRERFTSRQSGG